MRHVIYFAILSILLSCSQELKKPEEKRKKVLQTVTLTKKQVDDFKIQLAIPEIKSIGLTIQANGKMEVPPSNKTFITVPFGGFVKSISVLDGEIVKKGDELLTIEHPEIIQIQQEYLEIQASMELLNSEVERCEILVKNEAGSLKNLQTAKANYNIAKAKISGLKAKLEMADVNLKQLNNGEIQRIISIKAPFDGVVTKIMANVGEFSPETNDLMEIIDLKHTHAELFVFEKDAYYIKEGQKVNLKLVDNNKEYKATVYLVGKEVSKDHTIKVHCHLDKESTDLLPGTFFKASILTDPSEMETVASEAVVKIQNKDAIFVHTKTLGDKMEFTPFYVRVLKQDSGMTAFEYDSKKPSGNQQVVITETFEVLSTFLKINENEEE